MKRIKNKILISAIASLSSIAAIVAPLATTISTNNTSVLNNGLQAIPSTTITYNAYEDETAAKAWKVTLEGPSSVKTKPGIIFDAVPRPKAVHSLGYKFIGWCKKKVPTSPKVDSEWITDDTVVPAKTTEVWSLWPQFEESEMAITGPTTILSSQSGEYTATLSSETIADVTWKFDDSSWVGTPAKPSFDATVKNKLNAPVLCYGKGDIVATDKTGKTQRLTITVELPCDKSEGVWTLYNFSETNETKWIELNMSDLASETAKDEIGYKEIGATAQSGTLDRTDLDEQPILIGNDLTCIPDNFMCGWDTYDGELVFTAKFTGAGISKCTMIGKCFMQDCKAFNVYSKGDETKLELPDSIKVIDDGFLEGCEKFNAGTSPHPFQLPSNLVYIGSWFMNGCKVFNKSITIPESVTHVGEHFMANCDDFGKITGSAPILTIDTPAENFDVFGDVSYTLTTSDSTKPVYDKGVHIQGKHASSFVDKFINRAPSATITAAFRKLILDAVKFADAAWEDVAYWANKVEKGQLTFDQLIASKHFLKDDGSDFTSKDDFAGIEKEITINGLAHKVRVLEVQHAGDYIVEGTTVTSTLATFSFELATLLSNPTDGKPLQQQWSSTGDLSSFPTSTLMTSLNESTGADVTWYQGTAEPYTEVKTKSPYYQLTQLFGDGVIKQVNKQVGIGSPLSASTYNTYLFPLTAVEAGSGIGAGAWLDEGSCYKLYQELTTDQRVKKSFDNTTIEYWLSSPYAMDEELKDANCIATNGTNDIYSITSQNIGVSFAFCI